MFSKFRFWKFSKERTEIYSDAVFAIIVTLLVLEIKVPHIENKKDSKELIHAIVDLLPTIISWFVSFFFVSVMWVQHHNLFRMVSKIDYAVVWINNFLLLMICFMPFPTAMLGEYPENKFAILFFGGVITAASFAQVFLYYYMTKNYLLPSYNKKSVNRNVLLAMTLAPMLLIIATSLSFINLWLPYLFYGAVPFLFLLPMDKTTEPEKV